MTARGRPGEEAPADERAPDADERPPSRSERTRAATAVNRLGLQLTQLSASDLDRLELPERLRHEIDVSRKLKARSRGRQNRLIGQLLRAEDHEAIRERVEALSLAHRGDVNHEKENERWLTRILEAGDEAIEALIAERPDADRQRLRLLARNARRDPAGSSAKRARRELLRAIRALRTPVA